MTHPLNINLIIPFNDNKGDRLDLYRNEIEGFKKSIVTRVDDLKEELEILLGKTSEIAIAARSDGNSKKYYWRFKSSKRDRKYNRLYSESIAEYVGACGDKIRLRLWEIEEELIYINANLKLIKGMLDSMDQSSKERMELISANMHTC